MKKPKLQILVVMTIAFASFTLGFLLGRNGHHGSVTLEVPADMATRPSQVTQAVQTDAETAPTVTFPIDLNTAGLEELIALPGIGEVLAQRILDYRQEHGAFGAVEELMLVEGLGEKKLEKIIEKITIGG